MKIWSKSGIQMDFEHVQITKSNFGLKRVIRQTPCDQLDTNTAKSINGYNVEKEWSPW